METFLNVKKISISVFILIIIISCYFVVKTVNEVKNSNDINKQVNTITVSGTGEMLAVSDIASLTVNLNKEGKTAKEAQDLLNTEITKVLTYLKGQLIADKDIKSEYGGLNPKYSYEQPACYSYPCPTKDPKIIGYTATQTITIKVRVVDSASEIRTGLAGVGVTDISGPTFSIDDEEGFKDQARSKAILDAKEKAKVLAKDLGVRLGHVVSFNENSGGGYPIYAKAMMADSAMGSAPAPTLPKGENKITSNVTVTYEIK
ncbi:SIMPL domain-containing protein [Candidatus Nomurabacteria bacterium]|nr:SIMPL domain-containing protein [Candidatus Nomurabacteria bacterium]